VSADVTICIPAYRSEAFIQNTLRSVVAQSYSDFIVELAIEPPAHEILNACGDLLLDPRVRATVNPSILGWAGNIKQLLRRISTPYFVILFHDDLIVNDYIEVLRAALIERPEASVAYSDMHCFGDASFHWALHLASEPLFDRLMTFLLGGAEAVPVRGLARSSVLEDAEFPADQYDGFAAECEWVMHLLLCGPAVHVPRPLYLKRIIYSSDISAAQRRLRGRSPDQLQAGLEHHRERMLHLARRSRLQEETKATINLAVEAAVLRRHMEFGMGPFNEVQLARSEHIASIATQGGSSWLTRIQGMNLISRSQHALIEDDRLKAVELAVAATQADPVQWEAWAHLARLRLDDDRAAEALDSALRAWTIAPDANGLRQLIAECESTREHREFMKVMHAKPELAAKRFDSERYLTDHPDVAAAGLNAWQHYLNFGFREGRKVNVKATK
jgi:hypothetical protein